MQLFLSHHHHSAAAAAAAPHGATTLAVVFSVVRRYFCCMLECSDLCATGWPRGQRHQHTEVVLGPAAVGGHWSVHADGQCGSARVRSRRVSCHCLNCFVILARQPPRVLFTNRTSPTLR